MTARQALFAGLGFLVALICTGCIQLGESSELPRSAVEPTPVPYDRINCDEILGTAFRSDNERAWFEENCSKWPAVKVDSAAAGPTPSASATAERNEEPAQCAALRGRPYENNDQRTFFLQNCNQSTPLNVQQAGPDRSDCGQIRGTPYRSEAERTWYTRNCGGNAQQPPQTTPGPDRTDCNQIRGSAYRSLNERAWFIEHCR